MSIQISVVIPTYKRPDLLVKCLTALSTQELDKSAFEVIVVSDGPDQLTQYRLARWLNKRKINIRYLHTHEKKGPAAARNLGWLHAKAPLIAFTDDDCIPDKKWIKSFLSSFHKENYIAFSGCTKVPLNDSPSDFAANTANLEHAEFITANCACTKRGLIKAGGFDERFKLAWREDSDLQFNLLLQHIPIIHLPDALVTHPVRAVKWGISIREQKKGLYDALLFKKYPQLYKSKVSAKPLFNNYLIISLWAIFLTSIYFNSYYLAKTAIVLLLICIGRFIYKRLKNTNKSLNHILEMLLTSIVIPFLSVFWRIYGAIKFRVFFI